MRPPVPEHSHARIEGRFQAVYKFVYWVSRLENDHIIVDKKIFFNATTTIGEM
jgi:hypothetical protein